MFWYDPAFDMSGLAAWATAARRIATTGITRVRMRRAVHARLTDPPFVDAPLDVGRSGLQRKRLHVLLAKPKPSWKAKPRVCDVLCSSKRARIGGNDLAWPWILCPIESVDSSVPVCMKILTNSRWFRPRRTVRIKITPNFFKIFIQTGTELSTLSMGQSIDFDLLGLSHPMTGPSQLDRIIVVSQENLLYCTELFSISRCILSVPFFDGLTDVQESVIGP